MLLTLIYHPFGRSYYRTVKIETYYFSLLTMDCSSAMNHYVFQAIYVRDEILNTQDSEFLSALEDLVDINDLLL